MGFLVIGLTFQLYHVASNMKIRQPQFSDKPRKYQISIGFCRLKSLKSVYILVSVYLNTYILLTILDTMVVKELSLS